MLAGQTAVTEEEGEATQRHLTHSYCCIDYPRFIDMLQVRLLALGCGTRKTTLCCLPG